MTHRVYTDYIRDVIEALEKCLQFTEGMQFMLLNFDPFIVSEWGRGFDSSLHRLTY